MIIFNDDTVSLRFVDPPHTEQSLDVALRHLSGTHVGAVCWCLGEEIAYSWPSKVMENYFDHLDAGRRIVLADDGSGPGHDALAPGEDPRNVMVTLHRRGVDYLPILIDKAHQIGLKFYGSFRMNDCHLKSDPRGMLSSRFWQEHQEWRLWEVTDGRTYYNASLDYSFPQVRQRRLDAIHEVTQWYDLDGIELDFCRNPYTFQPSEAWGKREILTDFIRQVRRDLDEAARKWGRRLDLLMRIPFEEKKLRAAGMDVETWLKEGIIDVLVMSCLANDYHQSIEPWATRCREHNVAFYPSIEGGPAHNAIHNHVVRQTIDQTLQGQRAAAQNFIGQGASGVYMFNYPCTLFETRRTPDEFARLSGILSELGRQETLSGRPKQYTFWTSLPMQLESRRPAEYHQTLSFSLFDPDLARADTKVQLSFRQVAQPNPHVDLRHFEKPPAIVPPDWVSYWLNGRQVPPSWISRQPCPAGPVASGFSLPEHERITLTPPPSALRQGGNSLGFFIPRFPERNDPYLQIYELVIDLWTAGPAGKQAEP